MQCIQNYSNLKHRTLGEYLCWVISAMILEDIGSGLTCFARDLFDDCT